MTFSTSQHAPRPASRPPNGPARAWLARVLVRAVLGWLAVCAVPGAHATVVTLNYSFTATDFISEFRTSAVPTSVVTGSFVLTFDTALDYLDQTDGLVASVNLAVDGPIKFDYFSADDQLYVGGALFGAGNVAGVGNDFFIQIGRATGATPSPFVAYSVEQSVRDAYGSSNVVLTANPVPEPASAVLVVLALACGGVARRRASGPLAAGRGPRQARSFAVIRVPAVQ